MLYDLSNLDNVIIQFMQGTQSILDGSHTKPHKLTSNENGGSMAYGRHINVPPSKQSYQQSVCYYLRRTYLAHQGHFQGTPETLLTNVRREFFLLIRVVLKYSSISTSRHGRFQTT